jgi:SAM-dependent methyltransferase
VTGEFDAVHMARFFDAYGEAEWDRHGQSAASRVSSEVHRAFLVDHVRSGDVVLDAGSGPGWFTIELVRLGARVHVGDISPMQLRLNEAHVTEAGCEDAVVGRELLDIRDLSRFQPAIFDGVVCFGGPLSYVRDDADRALAELVRVTKPGGYVLVSVMSTLGAMRAFLPALIDEARAFGAQHAERIFLSGELERDTNAGHELRMYRWSQLAALCERHGALVSAAAANFLTAGADGGRLDGLTSDEWGRVLSWELRLCRELGVLDAGTHMLAAVRTPASSRASPEKE